jgi:hypothetical protein
MPFFLAERGMMVTAWDFAESGLLKTKKLAEIKGVTVQTELFVGQKPE